MTSTVAAGLLLALASAAALNWGYFAQHGAAAALPPLSPRRPLRSLRALFASPRWAVGFFVGIGGWVLYVGALVLAPLSLVQATSAGGIGLLALLVWRTTPGRPARREAAGVAMAVGGLVLLGLSLVGHTPTHGGTSWSGLAAWLAVSAVIALVAVASGSGALLPGAGFGLAAGVLYAGGDVATKAAVAGGIGLVLVPVLLGFHGLAFTSLQLGFQRGGALQTAGVATLFTNALPIAAGTTIFHETLPSGLAGAARLAAFASVVAGAAALARPGRVEDPPAAARPLRYPTRAAGARKAAPR